MSSALAIRWQVYLGAEWHWLYQTQEKLPAASHRHHSWSPPWHQNLAMWTQHPYTKVSSGKNKLHCGAQRGVNLSLTPAAWAEPSSGWERNVCTAQLRWESSKDKILYLTLETLTFITSEVSAAKRAWITHSLRQSINLSGHWGIPQSGWLEAQGQRDSFERMKQCCRSKATQRNFKDFSWSLLTRPLPSSFPQRQKINFKNLYH